MADAGGYASELREHLLDLTPDVDAEITKSDQTTQDFGDLLTLFIQGTAAVTIAGGLADFLRRVGTSVTIYAADGNTVVAKNVTSNDAARIAEVFSKKD